MSVELKDARERAASLDERLQEGLSGLSLPAPSELFGGLRHYLQKRVDEGHPGNNVFKLVRLKLGKGEAQIDLGPSTDKGPTETHFQLASGARLSFGISLKEERKLSRMIAYRFHLHLPPGQALPLIRFDLNRGPHSDPLREPRSHLHLGLGDARLPWPIVSPFEVLDRVFFVVEPALR